MARVLVVNGNTAESNKRLVELGGEPYGPMYTAALQRYDSRLECTVLDIAEGGRLPAGTAPSDFDGIAWTGSALSAYWDKPAVQVQIAFARAVADARVPSFGSCWGLQIVAAALGGSVRANPKGVEIGVARRIRLTEAGLGHVMLADKGPSFDAVAIHGDEVDRLPPDARLLATNDMSTVQAAEIGDGPGSFWGVQYHPEFDLRTIAFLLRRDATKMVAQGLSRTVDEVEAVARDFLALAAEPGRRDLAWRYGLDAAVLDADVRTLEFERWLALKVQPRAQARAAAA
jgi:GMP synthase (glutamine-hydrolysing)